MERSAARVELGLGLCHHQTYDGIVRRCSRPRLLHPGKNSRLAVAVGLAVAAIAALDLFDQFGIDLGINHLNRLLVPRAAVPGPETSFRVINGVPVALALAGASLALIRFESF